MAHIRRVEGEGHKYTQVKSGPYPGENKEKVRNLLNRAGQTTPKHRIKSLINRANPSAPKEKEAKIFARVVKF
jgi:hypothetical protein